MEKYIVPGITAACFVAVLMTAFKKFISYKKWNINDSVYRLVAFGLSIVATVLSWWIFNVPEEIKGCILFVFPVYVLQEVFDLDVIKRILKAIAKAKLRKAGAIENDIEFLNTEENKK